MNVTAIIQARMGSTRLPGKVLMEVNGKPLLGYLVERLDRAKSINKTIIATSILRHDDPIENFCIERNITCFRGSEKDVLDRYYQAARHVKAAIVMRITGDCPLLEPTLCDQCVKAFKKMRVDYLHTAQNFAEGLDCEVFTFDALEKSWHQASLLSEREHVTLFIRNHPELFSTASLENEIDDSWIRITVDCREDFEVVKTILQNIKNKFISINHIREYLKNNPNVCALNANIQRNEGLLKSLENDINLK